MHTHSVYKNGQSVRDVSGFFFTGGVWEHSVICDDWDYACAAAMYQSGDWHGAYAYVRYYW